ncbi:glycine-rich domain-containing protein [Achromobacter aegrifaciens]
MQASNAPSKSSIPFAENGTKNTIPEASQSGVTPGLASFTDGFPPLTMTPLAAGGVPPYGADFNGILNFLSAAIRWSQAGGGYIYDADFAAAVGGYPKGALLARSDLVGYWLNASENNSTNPDTGGAGWVNPLYGRLLGITTYATAGTFTFTPNPLASSWEIEVQGAGGGTGGAGTTVSGQSKIVPGGGAGGYAKSYVTTPFASATIVVGAGGAPGNSTPTDGKNGGSSSFAPVGGTVMAATGGQGSQGQATPLSMPGQVGGPPGGTATGGNVFNVAGGQGGIAQAPRTGNGVSGKGGDSMFSFGGNARVGSAGAGLPGSYGSGASGPIAQDGGFENGGFGGNGVVLIKEYA